jgi:hypothetical protein
LASSTLCPTTSGQDVLAPPHSGFAVAVELMVVFGSRSRIETAKQLMTIMMLWPVNGSYYIILVKRPKA